MQITPPFGYRDIVPLTKAHRVALARDDALPEVFRSQMVIPLSYSEFTLACHDYPVVFVSGDQGKTAAAMAVVGLEQGQNLFVTPDGRWDRNVYVPAYVRRYPYCMTRINVDGQEQSQRVVCIEKHALSDTGQALFDDQGEPLPTWDHTQKFLFEYENDLARTEALCRTTVELGLLETFTMQAKPDQGMPLSLVGMYRVIEVKIPELPGDQLQALARNGVLARWYAHLMSMSNFTRLVTRRAMPASQRA